MSEPSWAIYIHVYIYWSDISAIRTLCQVAFRIISIIKPSHGKTPHIRPCAVQRYHLRLIYR